MNLDMADVRPSVISFLMVTLMAIAGIVLAKYVFNRFYVRGLTELLNSV